MAKLAPSILSADFAELGRQVSKIEKGGADYVHVDVMDGHFVPNITYGSKVMKDLAGKTKLPLDVHLMIEHPEDYIEEFVTPQTEFITVHQEACVHLHGTIQLIKSFGIKAGVAVNPATPVALLESILPDLDLVLIMSVNPGFGGQKFIPGSIIKVCELDEFRKNEELNFEIEIDGGVDLENCRMIADAGVDILVAGSQIFGAEDIIKRTKEFKKILK